MREVLPAHDPAGAPRAASRAPDRPAVHPDGRGVGAPSRYGIDRDGLAGLLAELGEPPYRHRQVWDVLWRRRRPLEEGTDLPVPLRSELAERLPLRLRALREQVSADGCTRKWLWSADGAQVETVLMVSPRRVTVCVSTQAGCALGCAFCATGQAGFTRNLTAGEILEQVLRAQHVTARRVTHVVCMGMGEPLANWEPTRRALERLHADLGLSARHLTVSTVGWVPGMRRLAASALPVNLAVSLHAPDDDLRDRLVPINRRWPLREVLDAAVACARTRGRRVTFEYTLIDHLNDAPGQARALAELLRPLGPLGRHVNVIPLNPTAGFPHRAPDPARSAAFLTALRRAGLTATLRRTRGADIDAACGQLRARELPGAAGPARRRPVGKNAPDG